MHTSDLLCVLCVELPGSWWDVKQTVVSQCPLTYCLSHHDCLYHSLWFWLRCKQQTATQQNEMTEFLAKSKLQHFLYMISSARLLCILPIIYIVALLIFLKLTKLDQKLDGSLWQIRVSWYVLETMTQKNRTNLLFKQEYIEYSFYHSTMIIFWS